MPRATIIQDLDHDDIYTASIELFLLCTGTDFSGESRGGVLGGGGGGGQDTPLTSWVKN